MVENGTETFPFEVFGLVLETLPSLAVGERSSCLAQLVIPRRISKFGIYLAAV